jgi:hypothetical protein
MSTLDELFNHTDEDGDHVCVVRAVEIAADTLTLSIGDEKGWRGAVYLDHAAALRLAAALQEHYIPKDGTE